MRFVGRGHPAIRATHAKTLEFTPDAEITERATCVVATAAASDPPRPLAGPVRITVSAGDAAYTLHAHANPSWDPTGTAVIRRSPQRLPGTFATHADAAAADLPRDLVTALRDLSTTVTVEVVPIRSDTRTVVLLAADASRPADSALAAEYEAADTVDRQDDGARALVPAKRGDGPRHLVVATADLPRSQPGHAEDAIEYVGLPARLAVAAATPAGAPLVLMDDATKPADALRATPANHRLALVVPPADLTGLLAAAEQVRGHSRCVVAQQFGPIQRAAADRPPELFGRAPVAVCFAAEERDARVDPAIRDAVAGLLADGVPTKTAATVLARLTGMTRRAAYQETLLLAGARPTRGNRPT